MSEPYLWPDDPEKILELLKRQPGIEICYEHGEQRIHVDQAVFEARVEAAWSKAVDVLNCHGRSFDDVEGNMSFLRSKLTDHEYAELVDTLNILVETTYRPLPRRKKPGPN